MHPFSVTPLRGSVWIRAGESPRAPLGLGCQLNVPSRFRRTTTASLNFLSQNPVPLSHCTCARNPHASPRALPPPHPLHAHLPRYARTLPRSRPLTCLPPPPYTGVALDRLGGLRSALPLGNPCQVHAGNSGSLLLGSSRPSPMAVRPRHGWSSRSLWTVCDSP